ncbi:right-handed parallel beta-helix repeat-containing protein [Hufsiella ginkgonis]|uniref:Right-handed parallel beta-helix repeat-containing protein n=1 Tax=Hufsiella ginkgonis TaxID=2695274 RepID=A0A7K1XY86_9SPHI|nr:right-handed parallel beta-helix repeat-containing protein [Hufsiella ginkgonis]MXV15788.1 right-handed parallel beta-helix repeat-containing protein [Hufsiella ginkgonis]
MSASLKITCTKISIFCLLSIVSCHVSATNYYVSPGGNPRFNGRSPSRPKNLIQDAANLTRPGDTVFVMAGTYRNSCPSCNVIEVVKGGTKDKYIVFTNYRGHHPVIAFNGWGGFSVRNNVSYIKISGFEIIGNNANVTLAAALRQPKGCINKKGSYDPAYNGNGIAIDGRSGKHPHHIIISNNTVHDCGGGGISASQADYITFEDNIVYNTGLYTLFGASAISFYQFWNYDRAAGYRNVIRRNKCFNNRSYVPWFVNCEITDGNGIIIDDFRNKQNGSRLGSYKGRTLIENNVCWFNGGTGIHSFQSDHVDIINNTAYCNSQSEELTAGQILAGASGDIRIVNNILVADGSNNYNTNYANTQLTYLNNLHFNVTAPGRIKAAISNASCIVGLDPGFISPRKSLDADFNLSPHSPAINRGNRGLYSKGDFNHRSRTVPNDIGAFEH